MSNKQLTEAWQRDTPRKPVERFVLISLADQANDEDQQCWPSIALIRRRTGLAERTIRNALRSLEAQGLIRVEIGGKDPVTGRNTTSVYTLLGGHVVPHPPASGAPLGGASHAPPPASGAPLGGHVVPGGGASHAPKPSYNHQENHQGTWRSRPASLQEVCDHVIANGIKLDPVECEKFFDHFEANGWRAGRGPMRDWHAALRNWARRASEFSGGHVRGPKNVTEGGEPRRMSTEEMIEKGLLV